MKGLILKDLYMTVKYCRSYGLITLLFLAVAAFGQDNLFFIFYPCLLCGMIPANLLAYDERSRWLLYSATLPYSKAQLVSSKYLIGLGAQVAVLAATGAVQGLRMIAEGGFDPVRLFLMLGFTLLLGAVSSSVALPFMFRRGVEKGRMAYYVMIGVVCAGAMVAGDLFVFLPARAADQTLMTAALYTGAVILYGLSWWLAVRWFSKREL